MPITGIIYLEWFHHKNIVSLRLACQQFNIPLVCASSIQEIQQSSCNVVMLPSQYHPPELFPGKLVIYGPHHFIFPEGPLHTIPSERYHNSCFIVPSEWNRGRFEEWGGLGCDIVVQPFGIDTEQFQPPLNRITTEEVLVYYKYRHPSCLEGVKAALSGYTIHQFNYGFQAYQQSDYIAALKRVKFAVWVGCSETQGFALQEALSMNVPLLVWNTTSLYEEYTEGKFIYESHRDTQRKLISSTVPYWDERCGMLFYSLEELQQKLPLFIRNVELGLYKPREYVLQTLSIKVVMTQFITMIEGRLSKLKNGYIILDPQGSITEVTNQLACAYTIAQKERKHLLVKPDEIRRSPGAKPSNAIARFINPYFVSDCHPSIPITDQIPVHYQTRLREDIFNLPYWINMLKRRFPCDYTRACVIRINHTYELSFIEGIDTYFIFCELNQLERVMSMKVNGRAIYMTQYFLPEYLEMVLRLMCVDS